jgi:cytidyltransferase-like protein
MKIIISSMYGNPIHPGHVECLSLAKALGDYLIVIVNNDIQQTLKIGRVYQNEAFRSKIIFSLKPVDEIFLSIDQDPTVCKSIEAVVLSARSRWDSPEIIFAKGGDRFISNIPEVDICSRLGVSIVDGLGDKIWNSTNFRT